METTNWLKQHLPTLLVGLLTITGAFTLSQYKVDMLIDENKNLHKYTREIRKDLTEEQRRGDKLQIKVDTLEKERDESDVILKGVQEALNKNTTAVELLSAKLVVKPV